MREALTELDLDPDIVGSPSSPSTLGQTLADYFVHRADVLDNQVQYALMNAADAAVLYAKIRAQFAAGAAPIPMNKQKGDKYAPAYLTAIVNLLVEAHADGIAVDYDPRGLTVVTRDGSPYRTLARRMDGGFPAGHNPVALWEVKEYYYTTTFGSRVADGVYETLLDGLELAELWQGLRAKGETDAHRVEHRLFVDAHYTWWECGRSYLCRIIDMLHMGLVTEVIFGREVETRLPTVVEGWVARYRASAV